MDQQNSQEVRTKRSHYSDEFKQDAVRLVVEENYSFAAAARAVGVCDQTLRAWHAKLAPAPQPCGDDATLEQVLAENKQLRKQLKRAEMEREILKKATAYFANQSQ
jgi:transposase